MKAMRGGVAILKDIISRPFNYVGSVGEMVAVGKGLVALQSLSAIKKSIVSFNFQSNEPFRSFYSSKWLSQTKIRCTSGEYEVYGGRGIHPPITLYLKKITGTSYYQSNVPL